MESAVSSVTENYKNVRAVWLLSMELTENL